MLPFLAAMCPVPGQQILNLKVNVFKCRKLHILKKMIASKNTSFHYYTITFYFVCLCHDALFFYIKYPVFNKSFVEHVIRNLKY